MGKVICCECGAVFSGRITGLEGTGKKEPVTPEKLTEVFAACGVTLRKFEVPLLMGYWEGHDYTLLVDDCMRLYRHDNQDGDCDDEDTEETIKGVVEFCVEMNGVLQDQEVAKDFPDEAYLTRLIVDSSVLSGLLRNIENAVPTVCYECDGIDSFGTSFADDTAVMQDFPKLSRQEFLEKYPEFKKADYAATIRDVGYEYFAEELGWSVKPDDDDGISYVSQYSPAGEDFGFEINDDGTWETFAQEVREFYEGFDVDDHIEMWIEARKNGVGGVPSTRALCKDAEDIDDMLRQLSDWLDEKLDEMSDY